MATDIVLGDKRWLAVGPYRWARALGWLMLLAVLCVLAFNLAADASLHLSAVMAGEEFSGRAAAPPIARLIAVLVGSVGMLGMYAIAVRLAEDRYVPELGLRHLLPDVMIGLMIGTLLIAAIILPMWGFGWLKIEAAPITGSAESLKQSVQSAVIEEVLMRIIVFRLLWRAAGVIPALILTALLFGGLHLSNPDASLFATACLFAGEGIGAGLYLLTGRVWMSISMHAGWNFAQGWIFGSAVSGLDDFAGGPFIARPAENVSPILSGGGFGPESSIAALIVSLIASGVVLSMAWRKGRFGEHEVQSTA